MSELSVKKKLSYNSGVYRVPVPKIFIDNMGLKKGDEVIVIYKDENTLLITKVKE
ncbi:MAG: AbrB/MazE/SpoVT family DNA-binding domain-containing protein [Candidatus Heimdallarchaeota archaeon]